jgi:hypothetical protein
LPEYLDGELTGFWLRLVKAHLEGCPQCRQELEALGQVVQALKAAPVEDPGPEFWAQFNRELHLKLAQTAHQAETGPAPQRPWQFRIPYYLGAPALAILLMVVFMYYQGTERPLPLAPQQQMTQAPKPSLPATMDEQVEESYVLATLDDGAGAAEMDEDFTTLDLDPVLAQLTEKEREDLLKRLRAREKDGSCVILPYSVS